MTNNSKLNDLQLVLLSTAAQREDGSVFPAADSIAKEKERIRKAVRPLLKRALIQEQPIRDRRFAWREADDQLFGLFISAAGRELIDPAEGEPQSAGEKPSAPASGKHPAAQRSASKAELVLGLLRRDEGATLKELVDATGWLPHTTRAALTGLRKKGHVVEKNKRDDATCYRVAEVA